MSPNDWRCLTCGISVEEAKTIANMHDARAYPLRGVRLQLNGSRAGLNEYSQIFDCYNHLDTRLSFAPSVAANGKLAEVQKYK